MTSLQHYPYIHPLNLFMYFPWLQQQSRFSGWSLLDSRSPLGKKPQTLQRRDFSMDWMWNRGETCIIVYNSYQCLLQYVWLMRQQMLVCWFVELSADTVEMIQRFQGIFVFQTMSGRIPRIPPFFGPPLTSMTGWRKSLRGKTDLRRTCLTAKHLPFDCLENVNT